MDVLENNTSGFVSAAVAGLGCLLLPSQPHGGAVDLGALGPGACRLALHAAALAGQAFVDLGGHGEESRLHVVGALGARLQEGDLQRRSQLLGFKNILISKAFKVRSEERDADLNY